MAVRQVRASAPAPVTVAPSGTDSWAAGRAGLTSVSSLGTHAQGTVLQESIFVEVGSRVQSGLSRRMTLITSAHADVSVLSSLFMTSILSAWLRRQLLT
jgi:hypothetical protein